MKKKIVISAVNFTEMGPLSILRDALQYLSTYQSPSFDIFAAVHSRHLFDIPHITYLEFPAAKFSYLRRLYYEFASFGALSKQLNPYLWLSLHDITPSVSAQRRAVYCHNPSPFYELRTRDFLLSPRFAITSLLYSEVYRANIAKNDFVIVQQDWLREAFERRYGLHNVLVAHPDISISPTITQDRARVDGCFRFFYPCLPRVFKNVEVVLKAAGIMEERGEENFEVLLTFDGSENRYANRLIHQYSHLRCVRFLGTMNRADVFKLYSQVDCLVFASRLETWGLPITEFKEFGKPLLAADLPYAHETVGAYAKAVFFDPLDADALSTLMSNARLKTLTFDPVTAHSIRQPFAKGWRELFQMLLDL